MNPSDEMLKIAAVFVEQPDPSDRVKDALARVKRAPLSALVDQMIRESSGFALKSALKKIADLNQGQVHDLDAPDFRSYIIARTGLSDEHLRDCVSAIATYAKVKQAVESGAGATLIAARAEKGEIKNEVSPSDVLRELARRVK
jgi:hypothetical protein